MIIDFLAACNLGRINPKIQCDPKFRFTRLLTKTRSSQSWATECVKMCKKHWARNMEKGEIIQSFVDFSATFKLKGCRSTNSRTRKNQSKWRLISTQLVEPKRCRNYAKIQTCTESFQLSNLSRKNVQIETNFFVKNVNSKNRTRQNSTFSHNL